MINVKLQDEFETEEAVPVVFDLGVDKESFYSQVEGIIGNATLGVSDNNRSVIPVRYINLKSREITSVQYFKDSTYLDEFTISDVVDNTKSNTFYAFDGIKLPHYARVESLVPNAIDPDNPLLNIMIYR